MSEGFWTLDTVAQALGGGPAGPRRLRRIVSDSRTLEPGDVFIALRGENFDGHDFLPEVVARGAGAVVVSTLRREARLGVPIYQVPDTLVALGQLARYWRTVWGRTVVAVAGSNGKTSTKDLIAAALSTRFSVHATTGNLNNRIGVPATLLAVPPGADLAVVELGTSLPGEVGMLREIALPEIVVVTCVAEEHLEGLGDLEGVLREETAAYQGADVAIAPADQPEIAAAARTLARQTVSAGVQDGDLRADSWQLNDDGRGSLVVEGVTVSPPLRGMHNLRNTMLALAAARACGISMEDASRGIGSMPLPKMRSAWHELGTAVLINDAYNANPGSTRAAIELLRSVPGGRQRVIVLGTMRELGARSAEYHEEMARLALDCADIVAGVGDFELALRQMPAGNAVVVTAADVDALWYVLEPHLATDALILLKASRGVRLERLVPRLEEWAARAA
ncbi:UDP-N-acetylmuramoyl-tripeptide--D-alanyl-D-alanine ligase [soil metagenome]